MKSQPSPTTSTEAPTRIPKATNAAQADVSVGEATKTTLAATRVQHGSPSQSSEEILYERKPSWWIKWVWVLIGMDIIWSGNFAEFIWNRWTRQVTPTNDAKQDPPKEPNLESQWAPRPTWQRAGLSLLVLAGGTGIAVALLLAQARTITRIIRLPKGQVRVETARNWPGRGRTVDSERITARNGRDDSEVIVSIPGTRGEFLVGLDGATVRGAAGELAQVRQNFNHTFSQWKGIKREINIVPPSLGRWKSGPAA